jgi:lipoprotein-releasing system permease protein
VGEELAMELGLSIGDDLIVHSPAKLAQGVEWNEDGSIDSREMDTVYLPEEVRIAGVFSMGVYEYDANIVFLSIDQAADLFGLDWGSATSLHARVPDPFQMTGVTAELRQALPGYRVVTWQEANRQLFGALRVEKNLMFFLLFFIVIVAAFGIAGTLITVAVQKTREIGILKAVGMTSGMVARIFVLQGAIIGFLGTALGTGLGLLVIHYRNQMAEVLARIMGVEVFPKELYHLSQIPALVTPRDVVVIVVGAWLICVMASLMPAVYASLLSPAQALQEEN